MNEKTRSNINFIDYFAKNSSRETFEVVNNKDGIKEIFKSTKIQFKKQIK